MRDFPLYDREHLPGGVDACASCAALRHELHLTQRRNANLRAEIRFLNGLPPKGTNQQIEGLNAQVKTLQRRVALLCERIQEHQRGIEKAKTNLRRMHAEREAALAEVARLRSIPPVVAGDQPTFATNESGPWPFRPCGGTGVLWGPGATEGRSE